MVPKLLKCFGRTAGWSWGNLWNFGMEEAPIDLFKQFAVIIWMSYKSKWLNYWFIISIYTLLYTYLYTFITTFTLNPYSSSIIREDWNTLSLFWSNEASSKPNPVNLPLFNPTIASKLNALLAAHYIAEGMSLGPVDKKKASDFLSEATDCLNEAEKRATGNLEEISLRKGKREKCWNIEWVLILYFIYDGYPYLTIYISTLTINTTPSHPISSLNQVYLCSLRIWLNQLGWFSNLF